MTKLVALAKSLDQISEVLYEEHLKEKGFNDPQRSLERELMLICSEAFEMFEDYRHGKIMSDKIPNFTIQEEEAADMIIRILNAASMRGWRIGDAVLAKHIFNMNRPFKHGKTF
jgi:hypothetical protein